MSEKMKLYKMDVSPFHHGVLKLIKKHNIDVEIINVSLMDGEHMTEEYKAINSNQTVPCLVDGDIAVRQGNSILRYLCLKFDLPEYPQDLNKRIEIDELLDFLISDFAWWVHIHHNLIGVIPFLSYSSDAINNEIKGQSEERKNIKLNIIEERLSNSKFLFGDTETIADYQTFAVITLSFINKDFSLDNFPNIRQFLDNFKEEVGEYKSIVQQAGAAMEQMKLQTA